MSMMNMTGGGRVGKPITYFVRGDFDLNLDGDDDDGILSKSKSPGSPDSADNF